MLEMKTWVTLQICWTQGCQRSCKAGERDCWVRVPQNIFTNSFLNKPLAFDVMMLFVRYEGFLSSARFIDDDSVLTGTKRIGWTRKVFLPKTSTSLVSLFCHTIRVQHLSLCRLWWHEGDAVQSWNWAKGFGFEGRFSLKLLVDLKKWHF